METPAKPTPTQDRVNTIPIQARGSDYAISNGQISDGLSQSLRGGLGYHSDSDLRRELGAELQTDTGKSDYQQSGVSGENADQRGISGKASRELLLNNMIW